jgi:hypothetical protein
MQRLQYSLLAAAGILILAFTLNLIGPKRVMAALGYTPVREVNAPGRQPFAAQGFPFFNFAVPANKRLVITGVFGFATGTTAERVQVDTFTGGVVTSFFVPYTTRGSSSFANLAGEALACAEPGTAVNVNGQGLVTIHGYFVDVP